MPFWPRRIQLLSPVSRDGSYDSSLVFTRSPSLAPHPPHSWQTPESLLAVRLHRLRGGTLSGRFRRSLAEIAIAHRHLIAEHQVGSASRRADSHHRGFAPLKNTSLATLVAPTSRLYCAVPYVNAVIPSPSMDLASGHNPVSSTILHPLLESIRHDLSPALPVQVNQSLCLGISRAPNRARNHVTRPD